MSNHTYRENVVKGNARAYNGNIHGDVIDHDNEYKYYNNTYIGHHKRDPPKGTDYGRGLIEAAQAGSLKRIERYLAYDIELDLADEEGRTALHWAAHTGHEWIAQALIDAHCNIDATCEKHGTPLCLAALAGKESLVRLLLEHGADVAASCGRHGSALHAACFTGSPAIVKLVLDDGADVNAFRFRDLLDEFSLVQKDDAGHWKPSLDLRYTAGTPLFVAASKGHGEVISILTSAGADVFSQCIVSKAPIEKTREGCKNLIRDGDDCNKKTACGFWSGSPLHLAAFVGDASTLKLLHTDSDHLVGLVESGTVLTFHTAYRFPNGAVDWFHRDVELISGALDEFSSVLRRLALVLVACGGHEECMRLALVMAACGGHQECIKLLLERTSNRADKLALLLALPLRFAVALGHEDVAELLLTRGAIASIGDGHGSGPDVTPLHYAANARCVRLLARHGACIDARDPKGYTPLMWQAKRGDLTAVEAMLDLGASIHEVDQYGNNGLEYAREFKRTEMVKLLKAHGAKPTTAEPTTAKPKSGKSTSFFGKLKRK